MVKKRRPALSTVVDLMSEEAQQRVLDEASVQGTQPIAVILPDPEQPRQLLSSDLLTQVHAGKMSPREALYRWLNAGKEPGANSALRHDTRELRRLAESIAKHGLINPISLRRPPPEMQVPEGIQFLVVTGERRYWAHVLLAAEGRLIQDGKDPRDPSQIKAALAPEGISVRAHQIIENVMREDIDAVERARGFVALRNELSGTAHNPEEDESEGVNHGSPPSWRRVEEALDVSRRYRQYVTAVLALSDEAQAIIREHRLPERTVRPITQRLKAQPDMQVAVLNRLVELREQGDRDAEAGEHAPSTASHLIAKQMVDRIIASAEREATRKAKPTVQIETPEAERQAVRLAQSIKGAVKMLSEMDPENLELLAFELASKEAHDGTVEQLKALQSRLGELLHILKAQRFYDGEDG